MRTEGLLLAIALWWLAAPCAAQSLPRAGDVVTDRAAANPPVAAHGAASPAPAPTITNLLQFSMGFDLKHLGAMRGQVAEVRLYVSVDRGANWQLYERKRPSDKDADNHFVVRASGDGELWFASRLIDAGGRVLSFGGAGPEQRVLIDTNPPQLEFAATADTSGNVALSWRAVDPLIDPASLRIEYQTAAGGPWTAIGLNPTPVAADGATVAGQVSWTLPAPERAITFRSTIADRAGNSAALERRVFLPQNATRFQAPAAARGQQGAVINDPFAAQRQRSPGDTSADSLDAAVAPPPAPPAAVANAAPAASPPSASAGLQAIPWTTSPNPTAANAAPAEAAPATASPTAPPYPKTVFAHDSVERRGVGAWRPNFESDPTVAAAPAQHSPANAAPPLIPETAPGVGAEQPSAPPGAKPTGGRHWAMTLPPGERPRMTNSTRFALEYDMESVGPDGVAEVELWATTDGGRTWALWGVDADRQSPIELEAPSEGVYGFRIVVKGAGGLSGEPPHAGEPADVWIGVDTTRPTARITGAAYGQGALAGHMRFSWHAEDWQLGERPIRLLYSARRGGPWTVIAAGIPNTGVFDWQVEAHTPRHIFLRLEVRDEAGNIAVHELEEPVNLDGLRPKAHIRGVRPISLPSREAGNGAPFFRR